ncbi:MAG: sigma-70 family RNA polymerase sigma factor [Chloroflexota bacterium]
MTQNKNAASASARINSESSAFLSQDDKVLYSLNDEILAARVARGDSTALEVLYDRHASTVFGLALKVIGEQGAAEDVLQETFWRVWRSANTFKPERGAFTSWLFRIARNLAIDAYRRSSVRPHVVSDAETVEPVLDQLPDPDVDVVEQTQAILKNRQVRKALTSLPQMQRQVIEMAYFQGMTRHEIAEATGEALGTIHTRARLGLLKLREELNKEEFEG